MTSRAEDEAGTPATKKERMEKEDPLPVDQTHALGLSWDGMNVRMSTDQSRCTHRRELACASAGTVHVSSVGPEGEEGVVDLESSRPLGSCRPPLPTKDWTKRKQDVQERWSGQPCLGLSAPEQFMGRKGRVDDTRT